MPTHPQVRAARDFLLLHRSDYDTAYAGFTWPELPLFNFATDWFDGLAEETPDQVALRVVDATADGGIGRDQSLTFAELRDRSVAVAHWLVGLGVRRGDRVLLVLGNCVPLWEVMLAAIRIGAVIIPATPQLAAHDLADRVDRGDAKILIADTGDQDKFADLQVPYGKVAVDGSGSGAPAPGGWHDYATVITDPSADRHFPGVSKAEDPLLLYFTSGTTALPKLVEHTQVSYPIGHLSTMYWLGLRPGDVHLNISSPGWAKHAWSSFFAPWLAGASILVYNYQRFNADGLLRVLGQAGVTTFCAPPTVWRMLIQTDLAAATNSIREAVSAGEPLNPEVIEQVRTAWGLTIRDGYGQTETSAQAGNPPGVELKLGSMGRPLPGYSVRLVDPATGETRPDEGELCLDLDPSTGSGHGRPLSLMTGYKERADSFDDVKNQHAFDGGVYHTGDVVSIDADGYLTYVGRADDVFKASDYRISPFELESVLIEHPAVAEAAVVPHPDPVRLAVPKAYVVLTAGREPDAQTAKDIFGFVRAQLAPYKRIRILEFADLPKTISGKIRRVELRRTEEARDGRRAENEFYASDFD
ncbi:acetyl-CoA synthetase [Microlunatus endophyticus]|uniref:Acetyl-CoA synthetase n=1 Tax=Microlunatus endophyticus TaxID=1716077 RepID=A0A917S140_9ACTN|nr:AMP-binding protein [Microlunatus endophyticus]GGL51199.1 acetyl-CoA synthetase [Microlunatus endophyticus]